MIVKFDKEYLSELYYNGKCSDKKHRYQPDIVKRYKRRIDTLNDALGIEAEMLTNMQTRYNMQAARKDSRLMARLSEIRRVAAML